MRKMRTILLALATAALAACTTQEAAREPAAPATTIATPQQRSYLDPGPAPARLGGPSYMRDNLTSSPRQTDSFGNDVLPPM